jgi:hypothetical protein
LLLRSCDGWLERNLRRRVGVDGWDTSPTATVFVKRLGLAVPLLGDTPGDTVIVEVPFGVDENKRLSVESILNEREKLLMPRSP